MGAPKGNKYAENKGKHKKTLEWEEFGRELFEHGLPRAKEILEESDDPKFMFYFLELIEYFKPKLSRAENKTELSGELKLNFNPQIFVKSNKADS